MDINNLEIIRHLSNNEANRITRESLCTALLSLMEAKEFDKITISELVRKAGVSRQSFYRNYSSKEDIVLEIEDEILNVFSESLNAPEYKDNIALWFQDFFSFLSQNNSLAIVLHKAGLEDLLLAKVPFIVEQQIGERSFEIHYTVVATLGALKAIVLEWFSSDMKDTITDMADLCTGLIQDIMDRIHQINPGFMHHNGQ